MNCYYHNSVPAVGICKNCQKGICQECTVDVGNGLACKDKCETQVAAINRVFERTSTEYQRLNATYKGSAIGFGLLGGVFVIASAFFFTLAGRWSIGLPFVIGGVFFFILAQRYWMQVKSD